MQIKVYNNDYRGNVITTTNKTIMKGSVWIEEFKIKAGTDGEGLVTD